MRRREDEDHRLVASKIGAGHETEFPRGIIGCDPGIQCVSHKGECCLG